MLKILGETHPGRVRPMNQDAFACDTFGENCGYAVVCDGMGGEKAGDVASKTTCNMIAGFLARDLREDMSESGVKAVLFTAISAANAKVHAMARDNREYFGMGTTLVAAVIIKDALHVVSIGDSRLYLIDKDQAVQITRDHTIVQNMVDRGEITAQQALIHPKRHLITRAVGVSDTLDIDYQMFEMKPEYRLLLCTDGLSNYARPEKLAELVNESVTDNTTRHLVDYANKQGGSDNVTAVVMFCTGAVPGR